MTVLADRLSLNVNVFHRRCNHPLYAWLDILSAMQSTHTTSHMYTVVNIAVLQLLQ